MASPAKSNFCDDESSILKDVSLLLTKEPSYSTLPYSSILQLPSITKNMRVSYDYTSTTSSPTASPTKLFSAASSGNVEKVKSIVGSGVDIDSLDNSSSSSLHIACLNSSSPTFKNGSTLYTADRGRHGHLRVVEYLIRNGADVNKQDAKGCTPLYLAARVGYLEAVQYLVEQAGADINIATHSGWTPLNVCCDKGNDELVLYLIERGAELDKATNKGCTPLLNAVRNGHFEIVKYLAQAGADIYKGT